MHRFLCSFASGPFSKWRYRSVVAGGFFVGVLGAIVGEVPAELTGPTAQDRAIASVVSTLISTEHLTAQPLDDKIAERAIHVFLKQLDPLKFYFLQADVDEFEKRTITIDDSVRKGDVRFAFDVFRRFLKRMDERMVDIQELLLQQHDFTLDEVMTTDPKLRAYAKNAEQARDIWRQRIKLDLLRLKADDADDAEELADRKRDEAETTNGPIPVERPNTDGKTISDKTPVERLQRRYRTFAERMHQIDAGELLEMYLTSFTTSFDPHSTYMSRDQLEDFQISMQLHLEGIGAALEMDDGNTKVANVIPGGAAAKEGSIKPQDRIVSVGQGLDGPLEDVVDMKLRDVVKKIRGPAATVVRLGVVSPGSAVTRTVAITRETIQLEDSAARSVVVERGTKANGSPYRIGVIDLPSFYMDMDAARSGSQDFKSTTRDVRRLLGKFSQENVDVVVLNLRRNGGGSLTEAIDLTGLFIDRGPVVQVKKSDGTVHPYYDEEAGMAWSGPLVVLTGKLSASASEILAGAVQDYGRALIVGDQSTHGKGTVQSLLDLANQMFPGIKSRQNFGALKITIQQFYRPSGDSTQKRGVLADVPLPSMTTHLDGAEQDLEYAVEFDQVRNARFVRYNMVTPEIVKELIARSEARRRASEDFAKLDRDIGRYRSQKDRKSVTLNEAKFFEERAELDAEKTDEKQFKDQQVKPHDEVFEQNFYNNEVLDLSVDYLQLLANIPVAQAR
ncbi:MAG: carboxy terminal-processing peptidase [Planctomycetota bacterium]|nr:carboxy terminal-processing peptidase [Planctomycetota bacterium]MDA1178287.1 carboxy terminal-processing peptidase [Planctomycetota bacterium]